MVHATGSRPSEDRLLAVYAENPSPAQLEALVMRFQGLAHSLARRYGGAGEPFEDLLQVAELGLIKAIKGYDPSRPNGFIAYAVPTILGELRRHFRDRVWNLRLPRGLQEATLRVEAAIERLTGPLGHSPTVRELAEETGLSIEEINETLTARDARWTESLDAPARADDPDGLSRVDLVASDEGGYDRVEANYACASTDLDAHEWEILRMRFEDEMTQAEIGKRLGCSQMQVSRISRRALAKLLAAVRGEDSQSAVA